MENYLRPIEILLVEDNEADIVLTKNALKTLKLQNTLSVCRDGEEGLEFLYKRGKYADAVTPDLVLMDLNMPKVSGMEVLEQIKNDPKLSMIPVIILSTSSAEKDVISSYQNHANSYIKKPIDFMKFIEVIQEIENYWFSIVKTPSTEYIS
ncbi:MAG: CheY-like chemotaxis protein [Polaribacter sp.]|jgi:CheY-like chemotaxis protein